MIREIGWRTHSKKVFRAIARSCSMNVIRKQNYYMPISNRAGLYLESKKDMSLKVSVFLVP